MGTTLKFLSENTVRKCTFGKEMRAGAAKYLNKAWHKVEHTLGTNKGTIETWWNGDHLMVGFKCSCGKMQGVVQTTIRRDLATLIVEYHGEGR